MADSTVDTNTDDAPGGDEVEITTGDKDLASDESADGEGADEDDSDDDGDDESTDDDTGDDTDDDSEDGEPEPLTDKNSKEFWEEKARKNGNEAKNLRARVKALEAELKPFKDADLDDKERLSKSNEEKDAEAAELRAENARLRIQREFPVIDDDLIDLVTGDTFEAMQATAKKLADKLGKPSSNNPSPRKKPAAKQLSDGSDKDTGPDDAREAVAKYRRW